MVGREHQVGYRWLHFYRVLLATGHPSRLQTRFHRLCGLWAIRHRSVGTNTTNTLSSRIKELRFRDNVQRLSFHRPILPSDQLSGIP